jgi:dimethylglycine dehydrogenase
VDPYGVTHAYAKAAQLAGAQIQRQTRVVDTKPRPDGSWDVITEHGNVHAEHVVNAGGLWAREVGRMVGLELPVLAMEHQYLITEDLPEFAGQPDQLHCIDFEGEIYMRQERGGMLVGTYERAGVPWSPRTTPWDFGQDLLPNDLERIAPSLEVAFEHFPRLASAGIRKVVNGPFTFAPDGNPLVGPVPGLANYWVACGVMAGFSQGGGVGLALAHWMVDGDPGADIWGMDVARYGDWATRAYTNAKVRENYSRRFRIRFPNEELDAARPLRTTPIYDRLQAENAVFGEYCGLEHPLWFAPKGTPPHESVTFHRSNAHAMVGEECRAVREAVGLLEISNYGKFQVSGPAAADWLSSIMANRLPAIGRITLSPMLNERGRLIGDFTLCRLARGAVLPGRHLRRRALLPALVRAPHARRRRQRARLRHRVCRPVGGRPALARAAAIAGRRGSVRRRVSVHELPPARCRHGAGADRPRVLHRRPGLRNLGDHRLSARAVRSADQAGHALGLRHFGGRALNAMRLEKSFGTWAREYRPTYGPFEAGLGRFVDLRKGAFIGREAAAAEKASGGERRLITLEVNARDADASGDEPIWHAGQVVGWVTSGGYGHSVQKSLALGYVNRDVADHTSGFEVELIGERRAAVRLTAPAFDPDGRRMRG